MTDDLKKCDCTIEVECEVIEQEPIEIELEVKQYYDGAGQKIKEIYFNLEDWVETEETHEYTFTFYREKHQLTDFLINGVFLWDEETESHKPALADYKTTKIYNEYERHVDTEVILYSELPCTGKIILFGQEAEINN